MVEETTYRRIFTVILVTFWTATFFGYLGWKPPFAYNAQRYFQIFLLGCLFCTGAFLPVKLSLPRVWFRLIFALVAVMFLVIWQANNRWLALREGLEYSALVMAVFVTARARQYAGPVSFDRAACIGLTLFCCGCSLIVLEGLLFSLSMGKVDPQVVFGAFINIRILAELQFLTLLILPAAWFHMESKSWKKIIAGTAMLWWALLLLTGTRSALVVFPFVFLMLALTGGRSTKNWFKVLAVQFFGGVFVFLCLRVGIALFLGTSLWGHGSMSFARATSSGRLEIWLDAWHHFLIQPLFGNGPGAFACFTNELVASPHNLFILLLSEWGIIFTVLCLAIALLLFARLVKHLRSERGQNPLHFSLFATLVTTFSAAMMEGMITAPLQQMLIVLVFGWALHVFAPEHFIPVHGKHFVWYQIRYLGLILAFFAVTLWGVKSDLALQRQLLVSPDGVINLTYGPRFWADGHDHCSEWHERYQNRL